MFETSQAQFAAHDPIRREVRRLRAVLDQGLEGVGADEVRRRMKEVLQQIETLVKKAELAGPVYEDLVLLKSIYSRYQNYLNWLTHARS